MDKFHVIQAIGKAFWEDFEEFMAGQTVGILNDGDINYYNYDVERFIKTLRARK